MREQEKFSGIDPGIITNFLISIIAKKEQKWNISLQIYFVVYCSLMYSITIIMFGWKMWSKFNFIAIFLIPADFAVLLDHTKENADVSENCR